MNTSQQGERDGAADKALEALLTESEYSRITNRSLASIRRDRCRRIGCPYVKLGALVRYRPDDIRAYIESNRRTSLSDVRADRVPL
ncbi:MAG: transcriptional regulator [Bryobacteraceae bacterium]